ncbi:MAG: SCO family protein [Gammaproteobacteria bacterium]|nr:SCO family protein [Gammaproteobacteria bacterium]
MSARGRRLLTTVLTAMLLLAVQPALRAQHAASAPHGADSDHNAAFDRDTALAISQAAIGRKVGDYSFYDTAGRQRALAEYTGKPLIVSLIYTSCYHICPTTTQHIAAVVRKARKVLGEDSFRVITVGFDTAHDTADAMREFEREQQIGESNWDFLATDAATAEKLAADLGFQYVATGAGFDHLLQTSLLDGEGVVRRQIYGMDFDTPVMVDPLKRLVFGEKLKESFFERMGNKFRLFCTVYDPASDSYRFNYSILAGLAMGVVLGVFFIYLLLREWLYSRRARIGKV